MIKKIVILVTISAMIHNKDVNERFTVFMCNDKGRWVTDDEKLVKRG
ncbi:hypothetical protein [Guptibacillus spartinae]|nr:hypothetical protein [Pseudalkalibacillus spartinae]